MNSDNSNDKDTIIDLDADQVVEATGSPDATVAEKSKPKSSRKSGWLLAGVAVVAARIGVSEARMTIRPLKPGDRVRHAGRPEWGVGAVQSTEASAHEGKPCQRVTVRFEREGLKTLSTAFADLRSADQFRWLGVKGRGAKHRGYSTFAKASKSSSRRCSSDNPITFRPR